MAASIQTFTDGKTVFSVLSDYTRFATHINNLSSVSPSQLNLALSLFQWVCFWEYRQMSLLELRHAMALSSNIDNPTDGKETSEDFLKKTDAEMTDFVTTYSGGLLQVHHTKGRYQSRITVEFIDDWYKNFILEEGFKILLSSDESITASSFAAQSHERLLKACIFYVQQPNYKECLRRDEDEVDILQRLPLLNYATFSWAHHASELSDRDDIADIILSTFCDYSLCPNDLWHTWTKVCTMLWAISWASDGATILHVATRFNISSVFHRLLEAGADIEEEDNLGNTALRDAVLYGHDQLVKILLGKGANTADVQNAGKIEDGALITYAACYDNLSAIEILIAHGLKPTAASIKRACMNNRVDIMKILLEHGAPMDVRWDACYFTGNPFGLLQYASSDLGNRDMVKLLLQYGADVNAGGGTYSSPLIAAASNPSLYEERSLRLVELLVEAGADVNKRGVAIDAMRIGVTALDTAWKHGNKRIFEYLLAHGAVQ